MSGHPDESVPINGVAFEDILDGYFPLRESLRQMLLRNQCDAALIFILHAPAMEIPGLGPEEPVPLYITQGHGCMIHEMALIACLVEGKAETTGVANWTWRGGHRVSDTCFSDMHRLAEPAFFRGIRLDGWMDADGRLQPTSEAGGFARVANEGSLYVWLQSNLVPGRIARGRARAESGALHLEASGAGEEGTQRSVAGIVGENDERRRRVLERMFAEIG